METPLEVGKRERQEVLSSGSSENGDKLVRTYPSLAAYVNTFVDMEGDCRWEATQVQNSLCRGVPSERVPAVNGTSDNTLGTSLYCPTCRQRLDSNQSKWRTCFSYYEHRTYKILDIEKAANAQCRGCHALWLGIIAFHGALHGSDGCFEEFRDGSIKLLPSNWGAFTLNLTVPREHSAALFKLDIFKYRALSQSLQPGSSINIPCSLTLDNAVEATMRWILRCQQKHENCQTSPNTALPTRVLDLGDGLLPRKIKILTTNGLVAPYIALSYCWGNPDKMVKATAATLPLWEEDLPWDILPILFQDVIRFTRKLRIRYLWLDALCILQDDSQDWVRESANMASIYSNSYLTVAATKAASPQTSLFGTRWTRVEPGAQSAGKMSISSVKVAQFSNNEDIYVRPQLRLAHERFVEIDNAEEHVEDSPLLTRAWAFQERLLPVRTLHFHAEEMVWECVSGLSCECEEFHDERYEGRPVWLKESLINSLKTYATPDELGYVWLDVVTEYSGLRLTNESDRMPAVSGIASKFSGKALGRYIAGLWETDLARDLCYEQGRKPEIGTVQSCDINAVTRSQPSWSWTSTPLNGLTSISYNSVLYAGFEQDFDFKVLHLSCLPATKNPFSWVTSAELKVRGSAIDAKFKSLSESNLEIEVGQHQSFRTTFSVDSGSDLRPLQKLCCLLVGYSIKSSLKTETYQFSIVLAECPSSRYKRVGFLKTERTERDELFSQASVRTFDLA